MFVRGYQAHLVCHVSYSEYTSKVLYWHFGAAHGLEKGLINGGLYLFNVLNSKEILSIGGRRKAESSQ